MKEDNKKKYKTIILIIAIVLVLVSGITFAALTWQSDKLNIKANSDCFTINYTLGNKVEGSLKLFDESTIINSDNTLTIREGMLLTNVIAGISSSCNINGYLTLSLEVNNLDTAYTSSGSSTGALKYAVLKYSENTYPTVSDTALQGNSFEIVKKGAITSTGTTKIVVENFPNAGENLAYIIVFYVDGDLAQNDAQNKQFSGVITGVADQGTAPTAASDIVKLYKNAPKEEVTNNSITYNKASSVNLMNDRLGGTTTSLDGGNIRYYGASPNNYIYFNCSDYNSQTSSTCEVWRIIGVFDGKLKLIRNEIIAEIEYDNDKEDTYLQTISNSDGKTIATPLKNETRSKSVITQVAVPSIKFGQNDYSTSSLQKILNNNYYYGLEYIGNSTWDFTEIGIKNDVTRNLMAETTWNLGGWNFYEVYSNQVYEYERGTTVYSGNSTTWTGKIALSYPSDYGYAAEFGTDKCNSTLFAYKDTTCTSNNWMNAILGTSNVGWLLTPDSSNSYNAWLVNSSGSVNNYDAGTARGVSPVLYLNSGAEFKDGDGSVSNPYQLSA